MVTLKLKARHIHRPDTSAGPSFSAQLFANYLAPYKCIHIHTYEYIPICGKGVKNYVCGSETLPYLQDKLRQNLFRTFGNQ